MERLKGKILGGTYHSSSRDRFHRAQPFPQFDKVVCYRTREDLLLRFIILAVISVPKIPRQKTPGRVKSYVRENS